MDGILDFLADNYVYFMIGAVVLLLALIGFIVDGRRKRKKEEVIGTPSAVTVNTETSVEPAQADNTIVTEPTMPANEPVTLEIGQPEAAPAPAVEEPTLNFDSNAQAEPESIFSIPEANTAPAIGEPISMDSNVAPEPAVEIASQPVDTEPQVPQEPVAPVAEATPVVEQTPAVEIPATPEPQMPEPAVEIAPAVEEPVPTVKATPEVELAPVVEQTPVVEAPATPEVPQEPAAPVAEAPAEPNNQGNVN